MTELSRSDRIKAAREEFKLAAAAAPEEAKSDMKFVRIRNKSSQADNTVTNSITIKDQISDAKYVVSVSATMSGPGANSDTLLHLQSVIAKFLQNVHDDL